MATIVRFYSDIIIGRSKYKFCFHKPLGGGIWLVVFNYLKRATLTIPFKRKRIVFKGPVVDLLNRLK